MLRWGSLTTGEGTCDAMIRANADGGTTPEDGQYQLLQHYPRPHVIPNSSSPPHCGRPCHWSNHRSCRGQRSTGSTVTIRRFPSSAVTGKRHDPPIDYLLHYTQANRKQFNNQRKSLLARIIYHAWPHIYYGGRQSLEHRFFDLVLQRTHVVISSCVFNKPSEDVAGFYSRSLLFV